MIEGDTEKPGRRPARRRPRSGPSLRALMVAVLVVGGGLGWIAHRARVQREAVRAIQVAGGSVQYDRQWRHGVANREIWAPRWLVDSLGIDYFSSVTFVDFRGQPVGADGVAEQVCRLGRVETLIFNGSDLSDEGLARLAGMEIQALLLQKTNVTDAGLATVRSVNGLIWIDLSQTRVTDAGMGSIATRRGLEGLVLHHTGVGDEGLARLKPLIRLKTVQLNGTRATRPAVDALRIALPGANVMPPPPWLPTSPTGP